MAGDERTYGFSKYDAEEVVDLIGGEDREYVEGKVRSSGSGAARLVQVGGSAVAARSGTTVSSGSCSNITLSSGTLSAGTGSTTVHNIWPFALPAGMYILAVKAGDKWIAQHPGVVDVQWNNPDLEQTYDGTTLEIIDTAEACT